MSAQEPTSQTIREQIGKLERALKHAYSGSAEHGSFLRGGGGEYVPSVFMTLEETYDALRVFEQQAADRLASLEQAACPNCGMPRDEVIATTNNRRVTVQELLAKANERAEAAEAKLASLEQEQQEREREKSGVLPESVPVPDARVERLEADAPVIDAEWAIHRVTRMAAIARTNAGFYGPKILKGYGYPDEVMRDAQDARALEITLSLISSASDGNVPASDGAQQRDGHDPASSPKD